MNSVQVKLAKILLENINQEVNSNRALCQRDIANKAGISWDALHDSLLTLQKSGAIRFERNRIIINKKLLQNTAELEFDREI
jgi:DNA-binding GntR family transcriptional regulator